LLAYQTMEQAMRNVLKLFAAVLVVGTLAGCVVEPAGPGYYHHEHCWRC
jgi:H+/gluconate symporter-like permease